MPAGRQGLDFSVRFHHFARGFAFPARREDSSRGKERQYKTPLKFGQLDCQIFLRGRY
jgi:hypothetical protein